MRAFTGRLRRAIGLAAVAGLVVGLAGCTSKKSSGGTYQPPATWSISGTVSGAVSGGVTVSVVGRNKSAVTASDGTYTIGGLVDRTYTLEATLDGYTFTPPTRSVTINGANATGQDFTGLVGIAISGTVSGDATQGVTVSLTGPAPATTTTTLTTAEDGTYRFLQVVAGVYQVTPSLPGGFTFSPANSRVTVAGQGVTGPNFTAVAPVHAISGRVSGAVSAGVTLALQGVVSATAVTDATGRYTFGGLPPGSYTVAPTLAGYAFSPGAFTVDLATQDVTGRDFIAAAVHRVAGQITGDVLAGVTVTLTPPVGDALTTTTDASGTFEFSGLTGGSYGVTPTLGGYTFSPATRVVTVSGADVTALGFAATRAPTATVSGAIPGRPNVTMTLTGATAGAPTLVATTDATGAFALPGVPTGDYLLVPTIDDYLFDPASRVVAVNGVDVTGQDFTATLSPSARTISGTVAGVATAGVTVTLSGVAPVTATVTVKTDAAGGFRFSSLADGLYLVTPSLTGGFTFTPANCLVTVSGPSVTSVAFTENLVPQTISGKVSGAVTGGVLVALTGDADLTTTTAPDGSYAFTGLLSGTYAVTPSLAGFIFGPTSAQVALEGGGASGIDFTSAATHRIAGNVTGDVLAGVAVTLSGSGSAATTTDGAGHYEFTGLPDGNYLVSPAKDGYAFDPEALPVALAGADVTDADFAATLVPTYTVSGTVTGASVAGVILTLSGEASALVSTGVSGGYLFSGLRNGSYMVIPAKPGVVLDPASRAFRINGADVTGQDFTILP